MLPSVDGRPFRTIPWSVDRGFDGMDDGPGRISSKELGGSVVLNIEVGRHKCVSGVSNESWVNSKRRSNESLCQK